MRSTFQIARRLRWSGRTREEGVNGSEAATLPEASTASPSLHLAIIMDGNGRWAEARGLPRSEGHRAGGEAVRRTVEGALAHGIGTLTLYAFSSDNWKRPAPEVRTLLDLFRRHLEGEAERCAAQGVRIAVIGRRDRLDLPLRRAIQIAERRTRSESRLQLRIAIDYSSRDAILRAAGRFGPGQSPSRTAFTTALAEAIHAPDPAPEVDLLIRTGGERRLSDFLLWECAYAELLFTDRPWPEFGEEDLTAALADFRGRNRRFGAVAPSGRALPTPQP